MYMNGFAALDISPSRRYVVVKATAGFAVCRHILKSLLFYSCLDFTQNLGKTRESPLNGDNSIFQFFLIIRHLKFFSKEIVLFNYSLYNFLY